MTQRENSDRKVAEQRTPVSHVHMSGAKSQGLVCDKEETDGVKRFVHAVQFWVFASCELILPSEMYWKGEKKGGVCYAFEYARTQYV